VLRVSSPLVDPILNRFNSKYIVLFGVLALSGFVHLWNPAGFPVQDADEGVYIRRALHVAYGLGPQEPLSYYDHPYFGQIFLGTIFQIIGYPNSLKPSLDLLSIENLYAIPRLIMGLLAILDTFLVFEISKRLYNRNVAFISASLFAVMPITWLLRRIYLDSLLLPFLLGSILFAVMIEKSNLSPHNNLRKKISLVIISGAFLGMAIFTKIPAITFIPLTAYLIYARCDKSITKLGLWFVPVLLIPLLWPVYAFYVGDFDNWIQGVTHQAVERDQTHGLLLALNYFYIIDPVLLIIGLSSVGFVLLRKRDILPLIWISPIFLFFYVTHYVSVFHFIPILPAFCIAAGLAIEDLSKTAKGIYYRRKHKTKQIFGSLQIDLSFVITAAIVVFGFLSTTMLIVTNTASFQYDAAAFVGHALGDKGSVSRDIHYGDANKILITNSIYYWLFYYVFHFDHVFHKVNVSSLNISRPEEVIMMIDSDFKDDLSINGSLPKYSSSTKNFLSVTDNNNHTRWKGDDIGSWIEIDSGDRQSVCSIDVSWYKGNERSYNFVISASNDSVKYNTVYSGKSTGNVTTPEKYNINSVARYIKITVNGNNVNKIASINQIDLEGAGYRSYNQSSCVYQKIGGVRVSNELNYDNVNLTKRKNTLRWFYYNTSSVKTFNGTANDYNTDIYPYTNMRLNKGGSYVDVRTNFIPTGQ